MHDIDKPTILEDLMNPDKTNLTMKSFEKKKIHLLKVEKQLKKKPEKKKEIKIEKKKK